MARCTLLELLNVCNTIFLLLSMNHMKCEPVTRQYTVTISTLHLSPATYSQYFTAQEDSFTVQGLLQCVISCKDLGEARAGPPVPSALYDSGIGRCVCSDYCAAQLITEGTGAGNMQITRAIIPHNDWVHIQQRHGTHNFDRSWEDYVDGFGSYPRPGGTQSYWMGLQQIYCITAQCPAQLHIRFTDADEGAWHAKKYTYFAVQEPATNYVLSVSDPYDAEISESNNFNYMEDHDGAPFSTSDQDHDDQTNQNCAQVYESGWWYTGSDCYTANPNKQLSNYGSSPPARRSPHSFYDMRKTEMLLLPRDTC